MIKACELRKPEVLATVPKDRPGYYKWWAEEPEFRFLAEKLGLDFDECVERAEKMDGLYCIYVGDAAKESLMKRMNWHVNQHYTVSNVKSGTLSTFRKSISALVAGNQMDEKATNDFIDKLYVEWFPLEFPISAESKKPIDDIETRIINEHFRILNSSKNHDELFSKRIRKTLTAIRVDARKKTLS